MKILKVPIPDKEELPSAFELKTKLKKKKIT